MPVNYPDTASTDLSAFSLWLPDTSATSEEEMAMWAQAAGYTQPGFTFENNPLDVLDATLAWGQGGTTPAEIFDFQNNLNINWMSEETVVAGSSSHGVPLLEATEMSIANIAPANITPFPIDNTDAYSQDFSLSGTPSLTNDSALPSPQSDDFINGFLQLPVHESAPSDLVQLPGPSFPQLDTTGALGLDCAPPPWFMGGSNVVGQAQSNFDPMLDLMNNITYSAPWDFTQPTGHLATPTEALTTMVTLEVRPSTSLGKRSRQSDDDGSGGPKKRGRPSAPRVPKGAESAKRTRRSPGTRTLTKTNCISKAVGRGAERLVSTIAQGVYNRSLPGLSVSQGSVEALEQDQPSWIVGREQVETRHDTGRSVPQQTNAENAGDEEGLFHALPGNLSERERLMLQMSQAEEERGAVRVIKCRLCPKPQFGTWVTFQRHCKSCEKHPAELKFCARCGDYFGRPDSRLRHKDKKHQEACLNTSQYEAKQKKEKVDLLLKAFEARLRHCLKNGEEIGPRFSDVMTRKLMNTSKKVSKTGKISLGSDSWAAGLC